ncbi:MAG: hypothetical protein ABIE36_00670 [Candidatus Diapherotrites archaeon]
MRRGIVIFFILILAFMPFVLAQESGFFGKIFGKITGRYGGIGEGGEGENFQHSGPNVEDQQCMFACVSVGCESGDQTCMMNNSERCIAECGLEAEPEPENEGEACMQVCVKEGCEEFDFDCQERNMNFCEEECNMRGDAPDGSEMSEEQICISECVAEIDPKMRCQNSPEGEAGGRVCKKCAKKCEYLYAGPCLDDKEIKTKQKECETCKHCYGEPIMGDSGEGWECIINVGCQDASSEFGDEPGEGPGIGQEGFVAKIGNSIGGFFRNLFGGRDKGQENEGTGSAGGSGEELGNEDIGEEK